MRSRIEMNPIEINSRVRMQDRTGVVMAIAGGMCRVEWDDGNSDLLEVSDLVKIADEEQQPEGSDR